MIDKLHGLYEVNQNELQISVAVESIPIGFKQCNVLSFLSCFCLFLYLYYLPVLFIVVIFPFPDSVSHYALVYLSHVSVSVLSESITAKSVSSHSSVISDPWHFLNSSFVARFLLFC